MSTGVRLRPVGVMILALLRERDMHPYEMLRLLSERRAERLIRLQRGTFYHQVAALQRDGRIVATGVDREGNRPERTTYAITAEGDEAVLDWIRSALGAIDDPVGFRVALAEAHNLDRETARAQLARRLELLLAARDDTTARLVGAADREVPRQFLVELERDRVLTSADAEWTRALIADLDPNPSTGPAADLADANASGDGLAWGIPARATRHEATPRKERA